jgi:predicted ATP-grasp superfamily ATP-dependent carboligase
MSEKILINELTPLKKTRPSVIFAFTGPGFIGNTALMYIVRNKGFELKAELRSKLLPPTVLLMEGKPIHPFRIYTDNKDELLVVVSESLVTPESSWDIGAKLMDWVLEKGAKDFVCIEAMPMPQQLKDNPIFGFSIPERELTKFGARPLTEGGVSGLNAVLFEEALKRDLPWTTLLIPTALVSSIDYAGATSLISVLNKMYKLGVDVTPLKRSMEMRDEISQKAGTEEKRGLLSSLRRRG